MLLQNLALAANAHLTQADTHVLLPPCYAFVPALSYSLNGLVQVFGPVAPNLNFFVPSCQAMQPGDLLSVIGYPGQDAAPEVLDCKMTFRLGSKHKCVCDAQRNHRELLLLAKALIYMVVVSSIMLSWRHRTVAPAHGMGMC